MSQEITLCSPAPDDPAVAIISVGVAGLILALAMVLLAVDELVRRWERGG